MRRFIVLLIILIGISYPIFTEVWFSDLDLSENDLLLFRTTVDSPGFGSYSTLFLSDLKKREVKQLTFFPERVMLLQEKGLLQIQNRFGVFRSDSGLKAIHPIETFPSFVANNRVERGKLNPIQIAPNGKYLLYMRQNTPAFGDLILFDLNRSEEVIISKGIELSLKSPPVIWSPDSNFLIYSKDRYLYYFSIGQLRERRLIAEEYRRIGEGQISNARWGMGRSLYYLTGSLIYVLDSQELFTRALYSGYLQIGRIGGKIPFKFDPNFDGFWISPDGKNILLNKGGRNIFLYILDSEDFISIGETQSLPYLYLPRNTRVKRVLWTASGAITILTEGIVKGRIESSIFRLPIPKEDSIPAFKVLEDKNVRDFALSPDEKIIALIQENRVVLKDYKTWVSKAERPHSSPFHVLWASEEEIIIAGALTTEIWNFRTDEARVIALSQPADFGFSEDSETILAEVDEQAFSTVPSVSYWEKTADFAVREKKITSASFRVYLERSPVGIFRNMVMVRNVVEFGTEELLAGEEVSYEPFPMKDDPIDPVNFPHGSRIRQREVALVFNAIDSIEGLTPILNHLNEYKIRATFFINGEVIRRYPDAVREIAESGHEVGSLFYIYFNMTDSRFHLDKEFIKKGLARNENDYFEATGKELSLLWHAPYYFVSSDMIEASKEMNYTYIGRDLDSQDWVTRDMSRTTSGIYFPAARLVERIITRKKPGSIIPIMVGIPEDGREDYLFQKLDLLIDGLLKRGYSIVPVTDLIEHAK